METSNTTVTTKVYITNYGGHPEYEQAEQFGEFRYITKGYVNFASLDRVKLDILDVIKDSRPEDYLLVSGINIIAIMSGILWFHLHKKVNMLVWDKKHRVYRNLSLTAKVFDRDLEVLNDGQTSSSET